MPNFGGAGTGLERLVSVAFGCSFHPGADRHAEFDQAASFLIEWPGFSDRSPERFVGSSDRWEFFKKLLIALWQSAHKLIIGDLG